LLSPAWPVDGIVRLMDAREVERVYEKHAEALVRFATFLVGPWDAGDVVSSAVLKLLTVGSLESVWDVRAYLHRVVLNEVRMEHRRGMRRRARERQVAQGEAAPESPEPRPEVLAALARLSPRQRAVVFLTYWDDLSPASVAVVLGISEGSVRRHLARARQHSVPEYPRPNELPACDADMTEFRAPTRSCS